MPSSRDGAVGRPVRSRFHPVLRLLLRLAVGASVALAGVLSVAFIDANWRFAHLEVAAPARLFSSSYPLTDGMTLSRDDLAERLIRLGYRKVEGHPRTPGEFSLRFRAFEIYLNGFEYPEGPAAATPTRVKVGFGRVGRIENLTTGETLESARLEPEELGTLSGDVHEERLPVDIADLPRSLLDAVVAVEDRRFYSHPGIDPRAVLRALFANVRNGEVVQGGSTITQQLAKNLYPNNGERTLTRKVWETLAALSLEALHGKKQILERYLNQIYLAQRGPISIVGVGAASRHYFGQDPRYLDLPDAALLAGLIQSPGRYHPYRHAAAARERRNLALKLMWDEGFINETDYRAACAAPLRLRPEPSHDPRRAPYFIDYVAQQMQDLGLRDPASHTGLRVFTTLDPLLQARAETTLERSLRGFETGYRQLRPMPGGAIQGALVALRPADGSILAMVGGRDYAQSQFNRVAQAHRQPGSLFKPFVYLAGFRRAQEARDSSFTAATVLDDSPLEMEVAGQPWSPRNFDEEYRGPVSARQALAQSLNVPTIRAAGMIGLDEVIRTARRCGIGSPLQPVPSIALGTFEVTPLEMASAFTTIATLGTRAAPRAITAMVDDSGRPLDAPGVKRDTVVTPQAAYLTLDLMRDVVRYGTGAGLQAYGIEGEFAGKTGTTDDGRDAWFVGFSPDYLALTWVGFDNNRPLRLGGSALALPIWAEVAKRAGLDDGRRWEAPEGFVEEEIDPTTGQLAGSRCPETAREIFIAGTEPTEICEHQSAPTESWATRFLNWFRRD
ncbi:MAG TPA: PBP1A family penicillin-binding protein [Candidatus Polarisedimenticolia bacterium]|nr:PBP1A family penicillin-binding protein [Candidatus Polarisedimenticolia bacterium]